MEPTDTQSTNMTEQGSEDPSLLGSSNITTIDRVIEPGSDTQAMAVPQPPQQAEHPQGDEILKQVEYYFSGENLVKDAYLLEKIGGKENRPFELRKLCQFPKMRKYKPFGAVVESLKRSTTLEIINNKFIQRKVPLSLEPILSPEEMKQAMEKERRRNLNRPPADQPWMTKGMMKPTGFEEFFADAPVTPAAFAEEQSIYDRDISFETRIETAIQRYRARRKFHQQTAQVFNKFMNYGGIESGPKMFGGSNNQDLTEMDAAQIAALTAQHFVAEDVMYSDRWEVDFVGVAKGFLSCHLVNDLESGSGQADIARATNVMRNFYNYLLHHNVCPEYETQIQTARKICDLADVELFNVVVASERLPGPFNTAVSASHNGTVAGVYSNEHDWEDGGIISRTLQDCKDAVKFAISAYGSQQQYEKVADVGTFETVYNEQISLEVTEIEMADESTRALYAAAREEKPFLATLGKLHCRRWTYPFAPTFDYSDEALRRQQTEHTMTLWIEEDILQYCSVGMKIEGEVRELDIGIKWLDSIRAIGPSFFEWLPNELYKEGKGLKAEFEAQQQNNQTNAVQEDIEGPELDEIEGPAESVDGQTESSERSVTDEKC